MGFRFDTWCVVGYVKVLPGDKLMRVVVTDSVYYLESATI